jgi:anti-anti-sigma regulatory factor
MQATFKIKRLKTGDIKLDLAGDLAIKHSIEFKDVLSKCLVEKRNIEISLKEITSIDVTAIQLIQAFKNELISNSIKLSVVLPSNESILLSLRNAGLINIFTNNS